MNNARTRAIIICDTVLGAGQIPDERDARHRPRGTKVINRYVSTRTNVQEVMMIYQNGLNVFDERTSEPGPEPRTVKLDSGRDDVV